MKPLLKWVGGKSWHVPQVASLWDERGPDVRFVELFCGSAAITLGCEPARAVLNDANPHLINFYRHVKAGDILDYSGTTSEREYYSRREWFNRCLREGKGDSATAAGLFYYLNCAGFNNLWRVNGAGECNVPFRKGRENVPPIDMVIAMNELSGFQFTNDDFRDVILEENDFVYADPPYLGTFEGYTPEGFTEFDFAELVALLTGHPGRVVIMNSAVPLAIEICQGAGLHCTLLESAQKMQHSRGRNDAVSELMATNFPLTGAV
jgi:DNA adenine methylase